LLKEGIDLFGH